MLVGKPHQNHGITPNKATDFHLKHAREERGLREEERNPFRRYLYLAQLLPVLQSTGAKATFSRLASLSELGRPGFRPCLGNLQWQKHKLVSC